MTPIIILYGHTPLEALGFLPEMLSNRDPRPAKEQLDSGYRHGGGWSRFEGHELGSDDSLTYPGDPALHPIAEMSLRNERVLVYECSWVAIIQPDRSFEVCRMD